MFAVIFEVQPKPDRWDEYLALAKLLKPEIERIDGFIDNERFASQRTRGRLLVRIVGIVCPHLTPVNDLSHILARGRVRRRFGARYQ